MRLFFSASKPIRFISFCCKRDWTLLTFKRTARRLTIRCMYQSLKKFTLTAQRVRVHFTVLSDDRRGRRHIDIRVKDAQFQSQNTDAVGWQSIFLPSVLSVSVLRCIYLLCSAEIQHFKSNFSPTWRSQEFISHSRRRPFQGRQRRRDPSFWGHRGLSIIACRRLAAVPLGFSLPRCDTIVNSHSLKPTLLWSMVTKQSESNILSCSDIFSVHWDDPLF